MKSPIAILGFLGVALAAPVAIAQRSPEGAGPEVGLRLGLAIPFGEIDDGTNLDSYASSAVPLILEGGYRFDSSALLGLRLQYGFPNLKNPNGSCDGNNVSCDGSVVTVAVQGLYNFAPGQTFAPWGGLGVGYEWASADVSVGNAGGGATNKGLLGIIQVGGDVHVGAKVVLGPFIEANVGRFDSRESRLRLGGNTTTTNADINDTAWHTWLTLGVRGSFGF